ncbi:MAG: ion channel [Pseudomonadota bacterium]|nr:ion channel [Pseudomonadota bacterium]
MLRLAEDAALDSEIEAEVDAADALGSAMPGPLIGQSGRAAPPPNVNAKIPRMFTVRRSGVQIRNRRRSPLDIYHWLLTTSWAVFAAIGLGSYLALNTLFALLYLIDPHGIANARVGSFADAFFFSVETIGTIGYGAMAPANFYANVIMTAENFLGLTFVAVSTGVIFARVSRPTARVIFSRNVLVTRHEGKPTLMLRAANERANQILEAEVTLSVTKQKRTAEGQLMRRFEDLKVMRSRSPLFALTWAIMHVIDETSPLYGETPESMEEEGLQLIVVLSGVDETFAQRIHARYAYLPEDVLWDKRFADVIIFDDDGRRIIDYGRFHDVEDFQWRDPEA